ncbi:MAG TPA: histidine kinase, partial [Solirubrobacteraceae bacterium]|nr:histidine kinase [Solirubrobacteraceae bacterium]
MRERGRLKVFLGMVAGVGKTYRMLQEGHAEWEAGRDVVVGLLETHGRADTQRLADGLPMIPRRRVTYRGTELDEMD